MTLCLTFRSALRRPSHGVPVPLLKGMGVGTGCCFLPSLSHFSPFSLPLSPFSLPPFLSSPSPFLPSPPPFLPPLSPLSRPYFFHPPLYPAPCSPRKMALYLQNKILIFYVPQNCLCSPFSLIFRPLFPWKNCPCSPVPPNPWEGLADRPHLLNNRIFLFNKVEFHWKLLNFYFSPKRLIFDEIKSMPDEPDANVLSESYFIIV